MGTVVEHELEKAGHKPGKDEKKAQAARQRVIAKFLGADNPERPNGQFADPASFFK